MVYNIIKGGIIMEKNISLFEVINTIVAGQLDKDFNEINSYPDKMVNDAYKYMKNEEAKDKVAEYLMVKKLINN